MENGTVTLKNLSLSKKVSGDKAAAISKNFILLTKRKKLLREYFNITSVNSIKEEIVQNNSQVDCSIVFKRDTSSITTVLSQMFSNFLECPNQTTSDKNNVISFLESKKELQFKFPENNKSVQVYFQNEKEKNRYSIIWQKNTGAYTVIILNVQKTNDGVPFSQYM